VSCNNARAALSAGQWFIKEEVDARKTAIDAEEAWQLLAAADLVVAAAGKKVFRLVPKDIARDELLAKVIGPSGKLRAPTLRIGRTYYVGFHPQVYGELKA
jgi:hypothetical protein